MKNLFFFTLLLFVFNSAFSQNVAEKIAGNNAYVKFPSDYKDSAKKSYPVILFFAGKEQFGNDISKLLTQSPAMYVAKGENFEFDIDGKTEKPFIISIQPDFYYSTAQKVDDIIKDVLLKYRIDKKRVSAIAIDAGGKNLMKYMNYSVEYASRFNAVVFLNSEYAYNQVSADGTKGYKPKYFIEGKVKYWGICGTRDSFYQDMLAFVTSLNNLEKNEAIFTHFEGMGKDPKIWERVFNPKWKSTTNGKSVYEWMLSVKKP